MKDKQLSSIIEEKRTKEGAYPDYWPLMSKQVKALAHWCCERCGVRNNEDAPDGTMLTVHHLDGNKQNCEWWNLAALCQRCHLKVQTRVNPDIPYFLEHSEWAKPYVAGFYAKKYLKLDLTREEATARMDELLALEQLA